MNEHNEYKTVQETLDRYIDKTSKIYDATKSFHVSDMGKCMRYRYLKRQGLEQAPLDARIKRVFKVGDTVHSLLQNIFKKEKVLVSAEQRVVTPFDDFSGRYDAIVKNGLGLVVVDLKTVHSRKFHWMTKSASPYDDHAKRQVLTYFKFLKPYYPKLYQARLVYISKDDLCIREFGFYLTPKENISITKEILLLRDYWRKQKTPPPECSWFCGYCPMIIHCEDGQKYNEKKYNKTSKKKGKKK